MSNVAPTHTAPPTRNATPQLLLPGLLQQHSASAAQPSTNNSIIINNIWVPNTQYAN